MKKQRAERSIQQKVMSGFFILFGVSLLAFFILFIRSYRREVRTELEHMNDYNEQLSLNLDSVIETIDSFRYIHFSDDKIRNLLCSDDSNIDRKSYQETENKLEEYLKLLVDLGSDVLRAVIVTEDGRIYKNVEEIEDDYIQRMNEQLETGWEQKSSVFFSPVHRETISLVNHRVVSVVSPVWNIGQKRPIATIYLDLDFDKLSNQWYNLAKRNQSFDFMILSESQGLFDSQKGEDIQDFQAIAEQCNTLLERDENEKILKIHGKLCVAAVEKNDKTGWFLVQYMPVSKLAVRILNNMSVLLLVLISVVFITVFGSYVLAKKVSHPVKELSEFMGRVAGVSEEGQEIALFSQEKTEGIEEIQQMISSYNAMAMRINDNIIKDYVYKLNQKQAELKMLQFQINPHFLYNALNTISSIAQLQDVDYIPEIASGLSDMFRYNIDGREVVSLREEITQTENYMSIQKIRFPERFVVEISVDPELLDCQILKFILQPVVENSYKYGFKKKQKKDILRINGRRERNQDILLVIEDNGVGMEEEAVKRINETLAGADGFETASGIGLRNVNARIKNYYGDDYGIWLESEIGSFTRVYLKMREISVSEKREDRKYEDNRSGR